MRRLIDFHTHSIASDGTLSPRELVRLADSRKLAAVALTDHDTADGLADAADEASRFPELTFVPGIELSAIPPQGTLHILGLGIDAKAPTLVALMERLRQARDERNPRMIAKLQALGLNIGMDDVMRQLAAMPPSAKRIVGRLHMAAALREKGYVHSNAEAFDKYLGDGKLAYVDKERTRPAEAIAAIHAAGGLAVLAHPCHLHCENRSQLQRVVRDLMDHGLDGIEAYHSEHTPTQVRLYLELAGQMGLGVTGGSDFHGAGKAGVDLGIPRVPLAMLTKRFAETLLK